MEKQDRTRFVSAIHGTFEVYSAKAVSEQLLDIWWATLKEYSIDDVCVALTRHIADPERGQFPPKPADVIRFLKPSETEAIEHVKGEAEIQWLNVNRAISKVGSYNTPKFKNPITTACLISLGGWTNICSKNEKELGFMRKQFVDLFLEYERRPLHALPDNLQGREDLQKHKEKNQFALGGLVKGLADFYARKAS